MRVGISSDLLLEIKTLNPVIHEAMIDYYRQVDPLAEVEIPDWGLVSKILRYNKHPEQFLTSLFFQRYVLFYEAGIWCTKNHDKINDTIEQIKQERLLNMMQSGTVLCANEDLSRSIMRTLSEFRKHHGRRIEPLGRCERRAEH